MMHTLVGAAIFSGLVLVAFGVLAALGRRRTYRPAALPAPPPAARAIGALPDRPWAVYFLNYADGGLAYIGKAVDPVARQRAQARTQAKLPDGHRLKWWPRIDPEVRVSFVPNQIIWYPSRAAAEAAEKAWIRELDPPENVIKYRSTEAA